MQHAYCSPGTLDELFNGLPPLALPPLPSLPTHMGGIEAPLGDLGDALVYENTGSDYVYTSEGDTGTGSESHSMSESPPPSRPRAGSSRSMDDEEDDGVVILPSQ